MRATLLVLSLSFCLFLVIHALAGRTAAPGELGSSTVLLEPLDFLFFLSFPSSRYHIDRMDTHCKVAPAMRAAGP